jgi:hypothetical protein
MIRSKISTFLALVALGAALPALTANAASRPGYDARAQASVGQISAHRANALRECNAASAKILNYVWGDMESEQTRACMAQHGEVE